MFKPEELTVILDSVKARLLTDLDDVIWNWKFNYGGTKESPEGYLETLVTELKTYRSEFEGDAVAVKQIDEGLERIEAVVADMASEETEGERDDDFYGQGSGSTSASGERSVFDDVDE